MAANSGAEWITSFQAATEASVLVGARAYSRVSATGFLTSSQCCSTRKQERFLLISLGSVFRGRGGVAAWVSTCWFRTARRRRAVRRPVPSAFFRCPVGAFYDQAVACERREHRRASLVGKSQAQPPALSSRGWVAFHGTIIVCIITIYPTFSVISIISVVALSGLSESGQ